MARVCRLSKELVEEQQNEIEKAVIGIGKYRFDDEYALLEVPLSIKVVINVIGTKEETFREDQDIDITRGKKIGDEDMSTG